MNPPESEHIVRGYHGTQAELAEIIEREGFRVSKNPYDWLGDGVYFFQDSPHRASEWAYEHYGDDGSVIAAEIRLEHCMDLLDVGWTEVLSDAYDAYLKRIRQLGHSRPTQSSGAHRLDREVINYAVGALGEVGIRVDCVRAAFQEGGPVYPDSALYDRAHIQIAVRNPMACIRRIWRDHEALQGR